MSSSLWCNDCRYGIPYMALFFKYTCAYTQSKTEWRYDLEHVSVYIIKEQLFV